jgi:hypothetical protein
MYSLAGDGLLHTIVSPNSNHAASIDDLYKLFRRGKKMSTLNWSLTGFEERWFHALACILVRTSQQQDPSYTTSASSRLGEDETDESDSESDDDAATITPRNIAPTGGKRKLLEKFLDRLAETLAHEVRRDRKADDVCAAAFHENDGVATVYIAKNRALTEEDKSFMRKLQIWLQSIAKVGERRDFQTDKMWKTLVEWNVQRLLYCRDQLCSSFRALGVVCSTKRVSAETEKVAKKLAFVQAFCEETPTADTELAIGRWAQCITICYELRYEPDIVSCITSLYQSSGVVEVQGALRLKRSVAFFGRLRSA